MKKYSNLILETSEDRISFFINNAISIAIDNIKNGGGPFCAMVVKDDKIISVGINRVTATNDPTAHAEVVAIRDACRRLNTFQLEGCELYTTCEPCAMCLGSIYWSRLDKVYYGASHADAHDAKFDDSYIYNEIKKSPSSRNIPFIQKNREESLRIFHEWMRKEDKIKY